MKLALVAVGGVVAVMMALFTVPAVLLPAISAAAQDAPTPASKTALREIPAVLLRPYEQAPACAGLPWQVVAAIGWEESRHASFGGAHVDPVTGDVRPPIVGPALDGRSGFAAIRVPAGGSPWHSDPVWDHAVGPMQFITATWAAWGIDASGDGIASPHNAFDAIATTGAYLCGHHMRLTGRDPVRTAVRRYNNSSRYVRAVMAKAYAYGMSDGGDFTGTVPPPADPGAGGPVIRSSIQPVIAFALAHLGDPYVWGAAGPNAFDCSGLTRAAYQRIGIRLPHRSALQVRYGRPVNWHTEPIQAGDLLFMRGSIPVQDYGHVGIAVSATEWINAAHSGTPVRRGHIPVARLQAVRRLVQGSQTYSATRVLAQGSATEAPLADLTGRARPDVTVFRPPSGRGTPSRRVLIQVGFTETEPKKWTWFAGLPGSARDRFDLDRAELLVA